MLEEVHLNEDIRRNRLRGWNSAAGGLLLLPALMGFVLIIAHPLILMSGN